MNNEKEKPRRKERSQWSIENMHPLAFMAFNRSYSLLCGAMHRHVSSPFKSFSPHVSPIHHFFSPHHPLSLSTPLLSSHPEAISASLSGQNREDPVALESQEQRRHLCREFYFPAWERYNRAYILQMHCSLMKLNSVWVSLWMCWHFSFFFHLRKDVMFCLSFCKIMQKQHYAAAIPCFRRITALLGNRAAWVEIALSKLKGKVCASGKKKDWTCFMVRYSQNNIYFIKSWWWDHFHPWISWNSKHIFLPFPCHKQWRRSVAKLKTHFPVL